MSFAILVRNKSPGILSIPTVYGGGVLVPGQGIILNDTQANVAQEFGNPPAGYLEMDLVPGGQPTQVNPNGLLSGTATLVAGTVTVTGVNLTSNSTIQATRNTAGGTLGNISVPAVSRTLGVKGTGSFIISSSSGSETSTVDWFISG